MNDYVLGEFYARLIVAAWNPWRSLPTVRMSGAEFDRLTKQDIIFGVE